MIHLKLSQQDAERLHRCLRHLQQLSLDDQADVLFLLRELEQAQLDALPQRQCLTCNTTFSQDAFGRAARYCSNACKQKAYRQRINDSKRQFGPSFRP